MLSTVLYYELAMKVPIPVGITVYLLTWGLGHLRCLVIYQLSRSHKGLAAGLSVRQPATHADTTTHTMTVELPGT